MQITYGCKEHVPTGCTELKDAKDMFPLDAVKLRMQGTCSHWMQITYGCKEHVPTGCRELIIKDARNMFPPTGCKEHTVQGTYSHWMQIT